MTFFYFVLADSAHDFADDNTLSSFAKIIKNIISILEQESEIAINWFKDNHLIVNPGKFQAIIFDKPRILDSLASCCTMFLFAVFCKIGALERNAY